MLKSLLFKNFNVCLWDSQIQKDFCIWINFKKILSIVKYFLNDFALQNWSLFM